MSSRIFIVEDHPLMQRAVSALVGRLPDATVCGIAATGEEALLQLPEAQADLVLVDVSLPGMSGIELAGAITTQWPALPCLMLSGHQEAAYVERALAAGARGYVMKGETQELNAAILYVLDGGEYLAPATRALLQHRNGEGAQKD